MALIREPPGHDLGWYMSDDVRTTAIATDAFLDLRPEEPSLPKLVKGLFGQRRDGRWATTQDNLFGLVVAGPLRQVAPAAAATCRSRRRLGDKTRARRRLEGRTSSASGARRCRSTPRTRRRRR